jgi:hypothetical protein
MLFGLRDCLAWIIYEIGTLIQGVANALGSKTFSTLQKNSPLRVCDETQIIWLQQTLQDVTTKHYKVFGSPFQLTLIMGKQGYSLYYGTMCVVTGSVNDCKKYADGMLYMLCKSKP